MLLGAKQVGSVAGFKKGPDFFKEDGGWYVFNGLPVIGSFCVLGNGFFDHVCLSYVFLKRFKPLHGANLDGVIACEVIGCGVGVHKLYLRGVLCVEIV